MAVTHRARPAPRGERTTKRYRPASVFPRAYTLFRRVSGWVRPRRHTGPAARTSSTSSGITPCRAICATSLSVHSIAEIRTGRSTGQGTQMPMHCQCVDRSLPSLPGRSDRRREAPSSLPRPPAGLVGAGLAVPADDGVEGAGGDGVEDLRDQAEEADPDFLVGTGQLTSNASVRRSRYPAGAPPSTGAKADAHDRSLSLAPADNSLLQRLRAKIASDGSSGTSSAGP